MNSQEKYFIRRLEQLVDYHSLQLKFVSLILIAWLAGRKAPGAE